MVRHRYAVGKVCNLRFYLRNSIRPSKEQFAFFQFCIVGYRDFFLVRQCVVGGTSLRYQPFVNIVYVQSFDKVDNRLCLVDKLLFKARENHRRLPAFRVGAVRNVYVPSALRICLDLVKGINDFRPSLRG